MSGSDATDGHMAMTTWQKCSTSGFILHMFILDLYIFSCQSTNSKEYFTQYVILDAGIMFFD